MGTVQTDELKRPGQIDPAEWALRVELAACYRLFDWLGWTENIFNHITVRVPGPERHFLINPFGLWYDEVTASNLVKIDLAGNPVVPSPHPPNPAGFTIHSAIHAARQDAHCVIHTHTTTGLAVACKQRGLSPDNFYGAMLAGRVAYHDFEGITTREDEKPRLVASLGGRNVLVLRNHGLLVCERDIATAFALMWTLQRACDVQHAAEAMGGPDVALSREVCEASAYAREHFEADGRTCHRMFDAAVRRMERARGPHWIDYRT
jgi:ribulose-5-phosphate 4-epimerase/fuculose-1-phosphate aldolase